MKDMEQFQGRRKTHHRVGEMLEFFFNLLKTLGFFFSFLKVLSSVEIFYTLC